MVCRFVCLYVNTNYLPRPRLLLQKEEPSIRSGNPIGSLAKLSMARGIPNLVEKSALRFYRSMPPLYRTRISIYLSWVLGLPSRFFAEFGFAATFSFVSRASWLEFVKNVICCWESKNEFNHQGLDSTRTNGVFKKS